MEKSDGDEITAFRPSSKLFAIFESLPMQLPRSRKIPGYVCFGSKSQAIVAILSVAVITGGARGYAGGLTITAAFDSSITSDANATAIEDTINQVIQTYENTFSNPINVTIYFQEAGGLGSSQTKIYDMGYQFFRSGLEANQAISGQSDQSTALAHLPNTLNNPVTNDSHLFLKTADIKALGGGNLTGVTASDGHSYDGIIGLNTALTTPGSPGSSLQYSLAVVAMHEINEVLGLGSALPSTSIPFAEDLYRYDSSGARSFTTATTAQAYFSIDGSTLLAQFNQSGNGDYGDWQTGSPARVQDAFATPGANPTLGVELTALDVIGYDQATVPEPATWSICGLGIALAVLGRRIRRMRPAITS